MSDVIVLTGLPGSGKRRFVRAFNETYPQANFTRLTADTPDSFEAVTSIQAQVWCVIDVRSPLHSMAAEQQLQAMLAESTAVILSFVGSADLSAQVFWQDWLKAHDAKQLPRKRWMGQAVAEDDSWQTLSQPISLTGIQSVWQSGQSLERISIPLGGLLTSKPFHLEHLMMALEAAKNNLGMDIWRIRGCIMTHDYHHPVVIEVTPNRWDTYPAEAQHQAYLELLGTHFDQAWLKQVVSASQL